MAPPLPPAVSVRAAAWLDQPGNTTPVQPECKRPFQSVVSATSHQRGELLQMKIGDQSKTIHTVEATQCCLFDKRGSRQGARASEYLPCVPGDPQSETSVEVAKPLSSESDTHQPDL